MEEDNGYVTRGSTQKTLSNTTHYYFSVEANNRQYPRSHNKYSFQLLSYPIQLETVA